MRAARPLKPGLAAWAARLSFRRGSLLLHARAASTGDMGKVKGAQRSGNAQKAHYSSYVQILNCDNATAAPSVLLAFDSERFLFNCGEGFQRLALESKVRIARIKSVLATRACTDTLAGLPGLLLTLAPAGPDHPNSSGLLDLGPLQAQLIGPPGVRDYAESFRSYASHGIDLSVVEAGPGDSKPVVQGASVAITPLYVCPGGASSSGGQQHGANGAAAAEGGGAAAAGREPSAKRPRTEEPAAGSGGAAVAGAAADAEAAAAAERRASVCYVCEMPDLPGKFDPAKARALGVPPGPLFGQLQRGETVTTPAGASVAPAQVMDPPTIPGPLLLVLDMPSLSHLDALQAAPALAALLGRVQGEQPAAASAAAARMVAVVHLAPPSVTESAAYQAFAARFGAAARHVYAWAAGQAAPTCRAAATLQTKLSALEPSVFPLGSALLAGTADGAAADPAGEAAAAALAAAAAAAGDGIGSAGVALQRAPHMTRLVLTPAKQRGFSAADAQPPLALAELRAGLLAAHPRVAALLARFAAQRAALGVARAGGDAAAAAAAAAQAAASVPGGGSDAAALVADAAAAAAHAAAGVPAALQGIGRDELEVLLLGTVSAQPSSHRNVSSYYMDFFARGGALADCGEDAMGQLERRYGRADAERRVCELRFLWVSHMHADHHGGLYPLLARRAAMGAGPLLIIGPWPLWRVLMAYAQVLDVRFLFLPSTYTYQFGPPGSVPQQQHAQQPPAGLKPPPPAVVAAYEAAKQQLGLSELRAFPVRHVSQATGLFLAGGGGGAAAAGGSGEGAGDARWKVVFSGDTRPCDAVVEAARGATLLVHEATFEDELAADAAAKRHSTLSEALGVAAAAGVYRTVLTHFSGRYPKIPVLAANGGGGGEEGQAGGHAGGGEGGQPGDGRPLTAMVGESVAVGFDFMSVNLADLPWLPLVVPACDELLREEGFAGAEEGEEGPDTHVGDACDV